MALALIWRGDLASSLFLHDRFTQQPETFCSTFFVTLPSSLSIHFLHSELVLKDRQQDAGDIGSFRHLPSGTVTTDDPSRCCPDIDVWKKEETRPAEPILWSCHSTARGNGLLARQQPSIKLAFDARYEQRRPASPGRPGGSGEDHPTGSRSPTRWPSHGNNPILILIPKPLLTQWQDEIWNLLEMPSARWNVPAVDPRARSGLSPIRPPEGGEKGLHCVRDRLAKTACLT